MEVKISVVIKYKSVCRIPSKRSCNFEHHTTTNISISHKRVCFKLYNTYDWEINRFNVAEFDV